MGRILNFKTPTYDDVAIEDVWLSDYGVYIAGTDGIKLSVLPSKSTSTTKIVGQAGESFGGAEFEPRTLPLPAFIEDIDTLDSFKKLIMGNELKWFYFKNTNTKIKGIVTNEIQVKPHGRQGTFDISLYCPDPHFYESVPVSREFINPVQIRFWNDGNKVSLPKYEITGQGTVNVGVNGVVMTLDFSPTVYETLIVDTKTKEVRKGDTENRLYSNKGYVFPKMNSGENVIAVTGNCTKIKVTPNSVWI